MIEEDLDDIGVEPRIIKPIESVENRLLDDIESFDQLTL